MENEKQLTYKAWFNAQAVKALKAYPEAQKNPKCVPFTHMLSIGGSSDAALLNVSRYQTALDVYNAMINPACETKSFLFDLGHYMEAFIAQQFKELTGYEVQDGDTLYDHDRAWSLAQVDKFTITKAGEFLPLEIKTSTYNHIQDDGARLWGDGCEFQNGEIIKNDDLIPTDYFIQCQKQLYITKSEHMFLSVWIRNENKIRIFHIVKDEQIINRIIKAEDDFIFNHVIPEIPPVIETLEIQAKNDKDIIASDDLLACWKRYKTLSDKKKALETEMKEAGELIKKSMGDYENALDSTGKRLFHIITSKIRRLDSTELKKSAPDLYEKYLKETISKRISEN